MEGVQPLDFIKMHRVFVKVANMLAPPQVRHYEVLEHILSHAVYIDKAPLSEVEAELEVFSIDLGKHPADLVGVVGEAELEVLRLLVRV